MMRACHMIAVALVVATCRGEAVDRGPVRVPTPIPQDSSMPSTILRWRSHTPTIAGAAAGVSLDVVDGVAVAEGDIGTFHYVSQTSSPIQVDLWIGPDISLAWWRGRFQSRNPTLGAETAVTLCGATGARQEVSVPAQEAIGLVADENGHIGHVGSSVPPEVHVALAGVSARKTPFVVAWRVAADQRDALRADELHFLSAIRCR
jgi:hypothetical protein